MSGTVIGQPRCSPDDQALTAQRDRLRDLGVAERRISLDHGLTGTNRHRPGLDQELAAVCGGDTLVVPKLDRLARSVPDARAIGDDIAARGIKLSLGGQVYDPTDPWAKCSSTSSPPSPNSRSTSSGSAPARAWPWREPTDGCGDASPSSPPSNKPSCAAYTPPATTASPTSPNSSPCPDPPSTAPSSAAEDTCRRSYPLVFRRLDLEPPGGRSPAARAYKGSNALTATSENRRPHGIDEPSASVNRPAYRFHHPARQAIKADMCRCISTIAANSPRSEAATCALLLAGLFTRLLRSVALGLARRCTDPRLAGRT